MTTEPLTLKAVVDANIASLEGRGRKLGALANHDTCCYRYPDGCGCAIGIAIPDDHPILTKLDTKGPTFHALLINESPVIKSYMKEQLPIEECYLQQVSNLQYLHDTICVRQGDEVVVTERVEAAIAKFKETLTEYYSLVYPNKPIPKVLTE